MTHFRISTLLVSLFIFSTLAFAQHFEVGGFASYGNFDVPDFPNSAVGAGGRVDIGITHYLKFEAEGSYDFRHPRVEIFNNGINASVDTLSLAILHGNGGLKFQLKDGSYFFFIKGGVLNFMPEVKTTSVIGTISNNNGIATSDFTKGSLYPGGGVGFHAGPLGIRIDAGDEIYWSHGAKNNLRVTFGPSIRF
jgi:hypothetical protein